MRAINKIDSYVKTIESDLSIPASKSYDVISYLVSPFERLAHIHSKSYKLPRLVTTKETKPILDELSNYYGSELYLKKMVIPKYFLIPDPSRSMKTYIEITKINISN